MINKHIVTIVESALDGALIEPEDIATLFKVPVYSLESAYIINSARKLSERLADGKAEVHGQVGINAGPCGKNCQFCSFAAVNKIFQKNTVLPLERIVADCQKYEQIGVNAIYLMATANFPFEHYLEIAKEVRKNINQEIKLIANVDDFDYQQAKAMKDSGINGVYHALRLGEGAVTAIPPEKRKATFKAAKEAGLMLGTCLEPIGPEHTIQELVEKLMVLRDAEPAFGGAARRIGIPGTELSKLGMVSEGAMAHYIAVARLATGHSTTGTCTHEPNTVGALAGANLFWAEIGSNPRDNQEETSANRGIDTEKCKNIFWEAGWSMLQAGTSKMFAK